MGATEGPTGCTGAEDTAGDARDVAFRIAGRGTSDVPPPLSSVGFDAVAAGARDVPHMEQYRRWFAFSAPQREHVFFGLDIVDTGRVR
jgi:hypothetical protein